MCSIIEYHTTWLSIFSKQKHFHLKIVVSFTTKSEYVFIAHTLKNTKQKQLSPIVAYYPAFVVYLSISIVTNSAGPAGIPGDT